MTNINDIKTSRDKSSPLPSLVFLTLFLFLALFFSNDAAELVREGIRIAALCVIPSSFCFMILSDFYIRYGKPDKIKPLSALFSYLFKISPSGLCAFVCGNLSGFPIGMKMSKELLECGKLDSREATLLSAISNNPSIPFILGAVGDGMFKSRKIGLLLLFSLFLSIILTGIIFRFGKKGCIKATEAFESPRPFNLVESISSAAKSAVGIGGFIMFFSVIVGFLYRSGLPRAVKNALSPFIEITNAVKYLAEDFAASSQASIAFTGFSLGFGGLSVILQSSYFKGTSQISIKRHVLIKLVQGVICGAVSLLLYKLSILC